MKKERAHGDAHDVSSSVKLMERRKEMKALDKERHRFALENQESKPK